MGFADDRSKTKKETTTAEVEGKRRKNEEGREKKRWRRERNLLAFLFLAFFVNFFNKVQCL